MLVTGLDLVQAPALRSRVDRTVPVALAVLEVVAAKAAVCRAQPDPAEHPADPDALESLELLDFPEHPENHRLNRANLSLHLRAVRARLVHPAHLDPLDNQETRDLQDNQEAQDKTLRQVNQDQRDRRAHPDSLDNREAQASLDSPHNRSQSLLASPDHQGMPEPLVPQAAPELPEETDKQDPRAQRARLAHPDLLGTTANRVSRDRQATPEARERRESARNTVLSMEASSSRTERDVNNRNRTRRSALQIPSRSSRQDFIFKSKSTNAYVHLLIDRIIFHSCQENFIFSQIPVDFQMI